MAKLDLNSLQKAVAALQRGLAKANDQTFIAGLDADALDMVKSGVIQHFEITYELCWKFIKRWLETDVSPSVAEGVTRRELFRLAAENGLIKDVDAWMKHHDARNLTSHTYDPEVAEKVFRAAHDFAHDAKRLLTALEGRSE